MKKSPVLYADQSHRTRDLTHNRRGAGRITIYHRPALSSNSILIQRKDKKMKTITKTSRLAGQLEKLFRLLNADMFDGQLEEPIITVQSTPRAYGHYSVSKVWTVNGEESKHEVNIGAGTLDRSLEYTVATLLHEMCHMFNDTVLNIQDCSRGGTYHNKQFKATAESVGLIVTKSDKYGWAHTAPSDSLLEWIVNHIDSINEIRINRNEGGIRITGGNNTGNSTGLTTIGGNPNNHSTKYQCPVCRNSVRATKKLRVICGECMELMLEV